MWKAAVSLLMAVGMSSVLIAGEAAVAVRQEHGTSFIIRPRKPGDRIEVRHETDPATFILDVFSPRGIGGATVTLTGEKWPKAIVLRLHLRGLESFSVSNGKIKLTGSVLSHSGNTKRLHLTDEKNQGQREPGTEIKVLDAAGKPIQGLPGEGGYFEIALPKALLEGRPKSLELGWIDFYRG